MLNFFLWSISYSVYESYSVGQLSCQPTGPTAVLHGNSFNPLLGATWPIVYFLQGRLGIAAIFTQAYWFVCPAVVANISGVNSQSKKPNWLASATSKSVFIIVLMAISYSESIVDWPHSPTPPVPIALSSSQSPLLSVTPVWCMDTANFIIVKVRVCYSLSKHNIFSTKAIESFVVVWIVSKTGNAFLRLDFQKLSYFRFLHKDNAKGAGGRWGGVVVEVLYCCYSWDSREIVRKFSCMEAVKFTDRVQTFLGRSAHGPERMFSDTALSKGLTLDIARKLCYQICFLCAILILLGTIDLHFIPLLLTLPEGH